MLTTLRTLLFKKNLSNLAQTYFRTLFQAIMCPCLGYRGPQCPQICCKRPFPKKFEKIKDGDHTFYEKYAHIIDVTKIDAIRLMKCGPEDLWETCRKGKDGKDKMSSRDAYYHVVDAYPKDAIFKGYTYPNVSTLWTQGKKNVLMINVQASGKYISEEYLRGRPAEVTAASSAEEDPLMVSVPLQTIQPRREESVASVQVPTF